MGIIFQLVKAQACVHKAWGRYLPARFPLWYRLMAYELSFLAEFINWD